MPPRHALVTGGAGFIGSHLCEKLLGDGWKVTALDDLSTGSIRNVQALEKHPDFRILVGNAADPALLQDAAAGAQTVFHLAAVVGVRKVIDDPVGTIEKNLHSTEEVLRLCNRRRLRLLITSTSEVYGDNPKPMFVEDDSSIIGNSRHKRWSYAASKLLDEFHAFAYHYAAALPVTIVRLFNTVGPRQVGHYGMVVPTFVGQALRNDPITLHGDGSQRRCFTHVKDVVRVLQDLVTRDATVGQVFNVGSQQELTIRQLAETVKRMTGSNSPIVTKTYREAYGEDFLDMARRMPDVTKLRQALGYVPETPIEEMLKSVIDAMKIRT
jgi:UDP-glucose 4-epimerase